MNVRDALESDLGSIAELLLIVHQMHVKAQPGWTSPQKVGAG